MIDMPPLINPFDPVDIRAPVGQDMKNYPDDVRLVAYLLSADNWINPMWGGWPHKLPWAKGECTPKVIQAIKNFQSYYFPLRSEFDMVGVVLPDSLTKRKMTQVIQGYSEVVICSGVGDTLFNVARFLDRWGGELSARSVPEMVKKIISHMKKDPEMQIKYLAIVGHAQEGSQSLAPLGDEKYGFNTLTLKAAVEEEPKPEDFTTLCEPAGTQLQRLRGLFHPDAVVTLAGCTVAKKSKSQGSIVNNKGKPRIIDGKQLLLAVSRALGNVYVQGSTDYQTPLAFGMEGGGIRCRNGVCTVIGADRDRQLEGWWGVE